MNEQQPHLEILSHNRVNRSTIIIGVIPVTAVTVIFVAAVWPFLSWIAYGSLFLLAVFSLYICARLYLDLLRRRYEMRYVAANEHGHFDLDTWRHLPALPPPSVQVSEVSELQPVDPDDPDLIERSKVLNMREDGATLQEIVDVLGVPYWKVQRYCIAAVNLEIKKKR